MADLETLRARKGAVRRSEVPSNVVAGLNRGELESVNLVEFLVIDHVKLFKAVRPTLSLEDAAAKKIGAAIKRLASEGVMQRLVATGAAFHETLADSDAREEVYQQMATHPSDVVRNWAAYMDTADTKLTFAKRLQRARKFATDPNMGVREIAWMCVRLPAADSIVSDIERLHPLARNKNHLARRFAIEVSRPCGVWCKHIPDLKKRPEIAEELLTLCREDATKYVQDSVANWLNDASKTRPDYVQELCARWLAECDSPHTRRITHRALRTLRKKA
ncbi:DNA alkylation repair protein [Blastopirellula marina]|uniref:DNA alkylation repair protein n=1 Tax=Blastopirellula marina TaxID=124 RepID=A0A2S8G1L3_9BACT|nr:DNA alkylation repair protein [Blastopirellula marina]PQO38337.1 DNA alkylation repair protein [Blastopirellula marina]PTL44993.1 DNA alkylation repair protein [Blastopirellula marina]